MFNQGQFNIMGFGGITYNDQFDADTNRDVQALNVFNGDTLREVVLTLDTFALGASVTGDLYSNGLLHVYGTGATYDFTYGNSPAFEDIRITSIQIDSGVTTIGNHLFYGLPNLVDISIADSVVSIGASSFYDCASLETLVVSSVITTIGADAFTGCDSLEEIVNNYKGSQTIGSNAFTTSGASITPKYAYGWKANSDFVTQVETAGYHFSALDPAEIYFLHHTFPSTDNVMVGFDVVRKVAILEEYDADTIRNVLMEYTWDADVIRDVMKLYETEFDTKRSIALDVVFNGDTLRAVVVEGVFNGDTLRRARFLVPVKRRTKSKGRYSIGSKHYPVDSKRFIKKP